MRGNIRRWLGTVGVLTAAGAWALGQAGTAVAAPDGPAGPQLAAAAAAPAYVPGTGVLKPGSHGTEVKNVQRRLAQLHYYPGPIDGEFDTDTLEAVWAFKETQGIQTRSGADDVGWTVQHRLVNPAGPSVLKPHGGATRIEVNLSREYLVLYKNNKPELISHISAGGGYYYPCPGTGGTCGPAITPDGSYHALSYAPGWVQVPLGEMYNPVFFIGRAYAIHGDVPVPLQPVSHGCVRIPMDIASFFHKLVPLGTPIIVEGHAPGT